jgi:DNA-binding CsgD family transcriptional regulator
VGGRSIRGSTDAGSLGSALALAGAARAAGDLDEFVSVSLGHLRELLAPDVVNYGAFDAARGRFTVRIGWSEAAVAGLATLERLADQHPFPDYALRSGDAAPIRVSDLLPAERWERLEIYRHYYGPLGYRHQLGIPLPTGPPLAAGFFLARAARDFDEGELELARLVAPHLVAAHRRLLAAPAVKLTPREQEVLDLVADGLTDAAIAARLSISARTVEQHLRNASEKLGVRTRAAAVARALGATEPRTDD